MRGIVVGGPGVIDGGAWGRLCAASGYRRVGGAGRRGAGGGVCMGAIVGARRGAGDETSALIEPVDERRSDDRVDAEERQVRERESAHLLARRMVDGAH